MDTAATGDTFDISNLDRLGKSEVRMCWRKSTNITGEAELRFALFVGGVGPAGG